MGFLRSRRGALLSRVRTPFADPEPASRIYRTPRQAPRCVHPWQAGPTAVPGHYQAEPRPLRSVAESAGIVALIETSSTIWPRSSLSKTRGDFTLCGVHSGASNKRVGDARELDRAIDWQRAHSLLQQPKATRRGIAGQADRIDVLAHSHVSFLLTTRGNCR